MLEYVLTPAATLITVTDVKLLPKERSILKPVSLVELSVHAKLICLFEAFVAVRVVGATSHVLALAILEA